MEEKKQQETFRYSYSAKEQAELERIRSKYVPEEEDKMTRLRRLDESVTRKGTVISLIVGIFSSLILGIGMCCCMLWGDSFPVFAVGIIVGLIGIVGVALAYPLYARVIRKERERIAPEILRLTDELMK